MPVLTRYMNALSVAMGYRDVYTLMHAERVVSICEAIADSLSLDDEAREVIRIAGAFHDIGKLGVPDRILFKPGRLDSEERAVIEQHSEMGAEIILATGLDRCDLVARVVRHHHEHYDGKGYPDGLAGDQIPLASRIIGIADSYDAMAVTRSYSPQRSHDEIIAILDQESGRKHDPDLLAVFHEVIDTIVLQREPRRSSGAGFET